MNPKISQAGLAGAGMPEQAMDMNAVAIKVMDTLVEQGHADFLLLEDEGIRSWWQDIQDKRAERRRKQEEQARLEQLREQALSKLTPEECAALGLTSSQISKATNIALNINDLGTLAHQLDTWLDHYKSSRY